VEKMLKGKIPLAMLRLTREGRTAFAGYKKALNGMLKA
jgi:hypothetical protein